MASLSNGRNVPGDENVDRRKENSRTPSGLHPDSRAYSFRSSGAGTSGNHRRPARFDRCRDDPGARKHPPPLPPKAPWKRAATGACGCPRSRGQPSISFGFARLAIEPQLARTAGDEGITDADLERLIKTDAKINKAIETGDIQGYLEHNYRFHFGIYNLANAPVLSKIAGSLWLQMGPSLRIVCGRFGTANLPDKHSEALGALATGNGEATARAIAEDIGQGLNQVAPDPSRLTPPRDLIIFCANPKLEPRPCP